MGSASPATSSPPALRTSSSIASSTPSAVIKTPLAVKTKKPSRPTGTGPGGNATDRSPGGPGFVGTAPAPEHPSAIGVPPPATNDETYASGTPRVTAAQN